MIDPEFRFSDRPLFRLSIPITLSVIFFKAKSLFNSTLCPACITIMSISPGIRFLSQDEGEDQSPDPVEVSVVCAPDTNVNAYRKKPVKPDSWRRIRQEYGMSAGTIKMGG